jgi:peptide/nickel transport system substrate-binding protein
VDEALFDGYGASPLSGAFFVTGTAWWLESVYQTLTTDDGNALYQNGTVIAEPDLAQNWTVGANGTTYVFNLRPGVSFSNGDPFNCYQVWAQWYNVHYGQSNASNFFNGYAIFNFSNVNFGPSIIDMMNGTGIVNPSGQLLALMQNDSWPFSCMNSSTLVVNLKTAFAFTPLVFAQFAGVMVDSQFIINHGGFGFFPGNPVFETLITPGTGPYIMTQYSPNSYEEYQQNPNYWGNNLTAAQLQNDPYLSPGHYKTIFVYWKQDDLVRYTDLSTGAAQIVTINSQDWPLIQANPNLYGAFTIPANNSIIEGVGMNTLRYPTNITLIRQAIVHAINYTDLWNKVFFGEAAPLVGPEYSAFSQYYDLGNLPAYQYNMTLAQQDVQQSGVNTANLQPLDFDVVAGCGVCISGAQVIQADLGNIGIPVSVNVIPPSELTFPYVAGYGPYSVSLNYTQQEAQFTWMGYPSYAPNAPTPADAWLAFLQTQGVGADYANYGNPTTQKCVNDWTTTGNQSQIIADCTAAYLQIYKDAPYIWLGSPKLAFASGSLAYSKSAVASFLMDPSFTGESTTVIVNTVVPA